MHGYACVSSTSSPFDLGLLVFLRHLAKTPWGFSLQKDSPLHYCSIACSALQPGTVLLSSIQKHTQTCGGNTMLVGCLQVRSHTTVALCDCCVSRFRSIMTLKTLHQGGFTTTRVWRLWELEWARSRSH